jgi:hypothetical protein
VTGSSLILYSTYLRIKIHKMQPGSWQVFALVAAVGLLMFLSSFLTVDLHMSIEKPKNIAPHDFFHVPRERYSKVHNPSPGAAPTVGSSELPPSSLKTGNHGSFVDQPPKIVTFREPDEEVFPKIGNGKRATEHLHELRGSATGNCSVRFEPKCRINPLLKYWDDVTECYSSPLRPLIGLRAKRNEDRKFVVFQADAGGWNNIRMALEVVILFAQVGSVFHHTNSYRVILFSVFLNCCVVTPLWQFLCKNESLVSLRRRFILSSVCS